MGRYGSEDNGDIRRCLEDLFRLPNVFATLSSKWTFNTERIRHGNNLATV
jgi:hypothetical protein